MLFDLFGPLLGPLLIVIMVIVVFESCWRKCPPDKLMIVSGFGQMRSVSGKGTFVIPLLQRVDTLSLGAVQVQLTTENEIPTQDAILIHACAVANFQIGQTPELIETASKNYLNMDKEEMTRQVTEVMLGKMREVIGQMDLKELMRDRESFNAKVFDGSKDDLANLGLELRTFNVQDFSDSQGIIRSMGADQAAEIKKEAELAQIKAAEEVAIRQNQLDLKQADLKKQADKAKAEADMVKATVTAEKQRELYIAQQEAEIAAETKKVELAERQADVRERELNATVKKQAKADRYAAEQAAEADLYKRTKQAEAARIERQNASDAELYSAQKDAEGIKAKATAEAEATRLKGEADGASEKSRGGHRCRREGPSPGLQRHGEPLSARQPLHRHHAQGGRAGREAPHRRRFHQDVRIGQRPEARKGDHLDCRPGHIRPEGQHGNRPAVPAERLALESRYRYRPCRKPS